VLAVIANPSDLRPLNVEQEKAILSEALAEWIKRREVELQVLEHATISNINQAIRRFQPHVFHFVGHGQFASNRALIVLEDEANAALPVDEGTFQEFFNGAQETRLVVLNACQTATLSTSQPLAGLAPRLLQRQLSGVVAMQYPITDQASLIFAREFYRSLAGGYPVDAAVAEARKGLYQELGAEQPDWGTPVLFLRAASGQLFQADLFPPRHCTRFLL
jgi:CHAT domain-containing protein